jgi:hypothetical protein
VARLTDHLGADPRGLPILAEQMSVIEHRNVQAALGAWISGDGRSAELIGMSAEQKRYQGLRFSDLITPVSGGLMGIGSRGRARGLRERSRRAGPGSSLRTARSLPSA